MNRDAFSCRNCRSKENTLHVHHGLYRKNTEPWDYDNSELVTLCEDCHKVVESRREILLKYTTHPRAQKAATSIAMLLAGVSLHCPYYEWLMASFLTMLEASEGILTSEDQSALEDSKEDFRAAFQEVHENLSRIFIYEEEIFSKRNNEFFEEGKDET